MWKSLQNTAFTPLLVSLLSLTRTQMTERDMVLYITSWLLNVKRITSMYRAYRCTQALQSHEMQSWQKKTTSVMNVCRVQSWVVVLTQGNTNSVSSWYLTHPSSTNTYRHTSSKRTDNNWIGETSSSAGHLSTRDNKPSRPHLLPLFLSLFAQPSPFSVS